MNRLGLTFGFYVARVTLMALVAFFAGMLVLIFVIDFVEMLRQARDVEDVSVLPLMVLSLERTPSIAERAMPFAVLFGAMAAFLQLSRKLELVVARASGISAWQFLAPAVIVAALVGVSASLAYNPFAAWLNERAANRAIQVLGEESGGLLPSGALWLRQSSVDGQSILNAASAADRGQTLTGVTIYAFDREGRFQERIEAARAELEIGYWRLENGRVYRPSRESEPFGTYVFATNLTHEQLSDSFTQTQALSFWELPELIDGAERAGFSPVKYVLQFQTLLARPLLLAVMVLIAATVSLRLARMGGLARAIPGGIAAGFVLYVVTKLAEDLGSAGFVSPVVAAWTPAVVGLLMSVTVLLHQEDG
ncbi:LPS export ABC transporter permease LptG [Agaricicola taiwanensis]|uniref:LPS export ABC transporter permease LptG n=1 Tax=Agaricicola taiwanensis TaxID=591372 RepID=A0A8J2YJJ0_9RHOB|nr:LPS export ABC transporter permease LptG [Agaricicola taiwanensis]GGE46844.1 LPS export ABC transporter permease LptG [Agaricicola taiwanensis]